MKKTFSVSIALPGKHLQTFEARQIMLPSKNGHVGFMAGRQPLLTTLEPGLIRIIDVEDRELLFGTTGGFAEMLDNQASLLCDSLIEVRDINLADDSLSTGKIYNKDTTNMSESQKREYVKLLMIKRLRRKPAVDKVLTTARTTE